MVAYFLVMDGYEQTNSTIRPWTNCIRNITRSTTYNSLYPQWPPPPHLHIYLHLYLSVLPPCYQKISQPLTSYRKYPSHKPRNPHLPFSHDPPHMQSSTFKSPQYEWTNLPVIFPLSICLEIPRSEQLTSSTYLYLRQCTKRREGDLLYLVNPNNLYGGISDTRC